MHFLCLHGRGTNSDIFESQLSPLISRVAPEHTFDFIDAQFEGPAAPGIADVFPAPYLIWHEQYDPHSVKNVHDYLKCVIEEDGPYDGLIGFSEGAALAASYLLSKKYLSTFGDVGDNPKNEIKLAIFFNSIKPYSPSEEIGSDTTEQFQRELERHSLFLKGQSTEKIGSSVSPGQISAPAEHHVSVPGRKYDVSSSHDGELEEKAKGQVQNSDISLVFCFDPDSFPCKIHVPTLHVIGTKDRFQDYSMELTRLCESEQMEVAVLDIGHDIPRTGEELERIAAAFDLLVMMASLSST